MAGGIWITSCDAGRFLLGIHIALALAMMAGFQATAYGRFWVTPKGNHSLEWPADVRSEDLPELFIQRCPLLQFGRIVGPPLLLKT
jgi:hypothetical protein